jgi:DNA-binding GntR family transcriptional regulator
LSRPHLIQANKLSDQVYQHLLAEVLSGRLAPGAVLREVELADQLGVSRTPVREGLGRLAAQGLAEIRANRSVVVRQLGPEELRHTYQVREALEGMAAELAAARMTADDLGDLLAASTDVPAEDDPGYCPACHRLDVELHRLVALRSGNPVLARQIEMFHDLVQLVRDRVASQPGALRLALQQHRGIIAALKARKPALARETMIEHIRASCEVAVRSATVAAAP